MRLQWAAAWYQEWMAGVRKEAESRNISYFVMKNNTPWNCCWLFHLIRWYEGVSFSQLLHWWETSFGPTRHAICPQMKEFSWSHVWLFFASSRTQDGCFLRVINETLLAFISKKGLVQELKSPSQNPDYWSWGWRKETSHLVMLAKDTQFKTLQARFSCCHHLKTNGNHYRLQVVCVWVLSAKWILKMKLQAQFVYWSK